MSTAGSLNDRSKTELANLARRRGIRGWETMNKGDLVKALSRPAPSAARTAKQPAKTGKPPRPVKAIKVAKPTKPVVRVAAKPASKPAKPPAKPATPSAAKVTRPSKPAPVAGKPTPPVRVSSPPRISPAAGTPTRPVAPVRPAAPPARPALANGTPRPGTKPTPAATKPASKPTTAPAKQTSPAAKEAPSRLPMTGPTKDRIFIAVPDPHWLHVYWELSANSVQRAEAALKQDWYGASLIIRLCDVTSHDTTSTSETPLRDIVVNADTNTWYINVSQPPRQYRVDIGYLSRRGDFFPLAKSNVATPPKAGSSEAIDTTWNLDAKQAERTLARSTGFESSGNPELREFFEERLKRSLGAPKETGFGSGATPPGALKKFFFEIDARLVVYGRTDSTAHLTLGNDPVSLKPDGTFAMWFSLPDSRQIIPAVATSADGVEERTIVLAVERNTKYLDPMIHDQMNEV